MTPNDLRNSEEALMQEWYAELERPKGFVFDGAMDASRYLGRGKPRILFILKEAHSKHLKPWHLREYVLSKDCEWRTWNNVTRWKMLLDALHEDPMLEPEDFWREKLSWLSTADRNREMADVAVMNLKKVPGKTRSYMKSIYAAAVLDKRRLQDQFDLLDPDVVVVCGPMPEYTPHLDQIDQEWLHRSPEVQAVRVRYPDRERVVIYTYHPQASVNAKGMVVGMARAVRSL